MKKNNCLIAAVLLLAMVLSASSSAAEVEKRKIYICDGEVRVYELTKNFPAPKGLSYDSAEQIKGSIEIISGLMDGAQEKSIVEISYGEVLSFFPIPVINEITSTANLSWKNDKLEESVVIKTSPKISIFYFFAFFFLYPGLFVFLLFDKKFLEYRKYKNHFLVILFLTMPWVTGLATANQLNQAGVGIIFSLLFSLLIIKSKVEISFFFLFLMLCIVFFSQSLHNFFLSYFLFLLGFSLVAVCIYYYREKKQCPAIAEQES
jgi:hypothetical protein